MFWSKLKCIMIPLCWYHLVFMTDIELHGGNVIAPPYGRTLAFPHTVCSVVTVKSASSIKPIFKEPGMPTLHEWEFEVVDVECREIVFLSIVLKPSCKMEMSTPTALSNYTRFANLPLILPRNAALSSIISPCGGQNSAFQCRFHNCDIPVLLLGHGDAKYATVLSDYCQFLLKIQLNFFDIVKKSDVM